MLAYSEQRPGMLLNIHDAEDGPATENYLAQSVNSAKVKKPCFRPQFLKSSISWSETEELQVHILTAHIDTQTQSRKIYLEIFPSSSQALQGSIWHALCLPFKLYHSFATAPPSPFPSVSGLSMLFTVAVTVFLPSPRSQSVSLWSLKSNLTGLNCLYTPPRLCNSKSL